MLENFFPVQQLQRATVFLLLVILTVLIAPILISQLLVDVWNKKSKKDTFPNLDRSEKLNKDHLEEKLSLDDIEAREYIYDPLNAVPHLPFGHNNSLWVKFKVQLEEEDELWSFSAVLKNNYGQNQKQKGYAVLRDSQIQSCYYSEKYVISEQRPMTHESEAPKW